MKTATVLTFRQVEVIEVDIISYFIRWINLCANLGFK